MKWWLAATLTSWILGWITRPLLRRLGIIDKPNARSSHTIPTVRAGGVGLVICWVTLAACAGPHLAQPDSLGLLLLLTVVIALVSLLDDIRPVSALFRLGVHLALAVGVLVLLPVSGLGFVGLMVATVVISGYTNAFNFMDGINGMASMQAMLTGAGTTLIALGAGAQANEPSVWLGLVVSGSAAGFLPHNFPRARIFMGDVGSASLGFLLSALAVWVTTEHDWKLAGAFGILHANFLLDTGLTLGRRVLRGEKWREAHREHFYQRLVLAGCSHTRVTLSYGGLQLIALFAAWRTVDQDGSAIVLIAAGIALMWCLYFTWCEMIYRARRPAGKTGSRSP